MLNRWTECSTGCFYHPATVYEQNLDAWNGTRIVFNPSEYWAEHPDAKLYAADPDTALQDVGAVDIGYIDDARIIIEGHPRLVAAMHIDNNNTYGKMALDHYYAGMFGISIADIFEAAEGVVTGGIEPNHVLVFKEEGWNQPADKGAVAAATRKKVIGFANSFSQTTSDKPAAAQSAYDVESIISKCFERVKSLFNSGSPEVQSSASNSEQKPDTKIMADETKPEPQVAALNQQIGALEKEKTELSIKLETTSAELTEKTATIEKQAAELEELKKEKAEIEKAKQEAAFTEFLSEVPDGEKDSEEKKTALHSMFFGDPLTLAKKTKEWALNQAKPLPGKAGSIGVSANTLNEKPGRRYGDLFHKAGV